MVVMVFMIKYEYLDDFHVNVIQQENRIDANSRNVEQQQQHLQLNIIVEEFNLFDHVDIGIDH